MRHLLALVLLFPAAACADDKPSFVVHTGHFEKNTAGLKDEPSLLLLKDDESFAKVFGVVPSGSLRKNNPVTKDLFAENVVAAVIKRGKGITTYTEVSAKADGDTLTVNFKSEEGKPGNATFASPLIVSVPKGKVAKVVFVENGKEIGSAK